jgi:hypothetical protein
MSSEYKFTASELAGLAVIVLILLFFPYLMISEHAQDVVAMSYYHNGR